MISDYERSTEDERGWEDIFKILESGLRVDCRMTRNESTHLLVPWRFTSPFVEGMVGRW